MAISDKLTYLNDTKLQLKDMINYGLDTGEKITSETTFRNYVKSLFDAFIKTMTYPDVLYENLQKVTGTGTSVTLNGTAEAPMRNILSPSAISQETTTGKNKLNVPSNYSVTGVVNYKTKLTEIGAGTYKLTCWNVTKGGNDFPVLRVNNTSYIVSSNKDTNFVIPDSITEAYFYSNGYNYSASQGVTSIIENLMISESGGDYEPYTNGPSPNPDYPQDIHTVSGDNEVVIENKNIAKSDWAERFVSAINNSSYAKLETKDNKSCLFYTQSAGYGSYDTKNLSLGMTFKENTQYTISYDIFKTTSNSRTVAIYYTDGTNTQASNLNEANKWEHQTITSTAGKTIDYICPYYTSGSTYIDINTWQIEEGTSASEYEEHQEQSLPLNLGDLEYCKIVNYEDSFIRTSGKNLFDESNMIKGYYNTNDLSITLDNSYRTMVVDNLPAGTYTFSTTLTNCRILRWATGNTNTGIGQDLNNLTITTTQTAKLMICFRKEPTSVITETFYTMLNKGATSLPYEPYGTNEWYLKQNIGKVVFDGSSDENWSLQTNVDKLNYYIKIENSLGGSNYLIYSNIGVHRSDLWSENYTTYISSSNNLNYHCDSIPTLNDFKTYLNTTNMIVYYRTATPTFTSLSDTLQTQLENIYKALSYNGQTNVSQENADLPFVIKLSAIRDLSGIFELISQSEEI